MNLYVLCFGLGVAIGGIIVGVLANRAPQMFAHVVKMANAVDNVVNTSASKATAAAAEKISANK